MSLKNKGRLTLLVGIVMVLIGVTALVVSLSIVISRPKSSPPPDNVAPIKSKHLELLAVAEQREQRIAQLLQQLSSAEEKLAAVEGRLEIERQAADPLREKLNATAQERDAAMASNKKLEAELQQLRKAVAESKTASASQAEKLLLADKKVAELDKTVAALKAQLETAEKTQSETQAKLEAQTQAFQQAQEQGKQYKVEIASLTEKVNGVLAERDQLLQKIKDLEEAAKIPVVPETTEVE